MARAEASLETLQAETGDISKAGRESVSKVFEVFLENLRLRCCSAELCRDGTSRQF